MPTYEYLCPAGHQFEVLQKMSDRPRAKCPRCGKVAARQMSGGAGLIFKGSGFYITDYGKDGKGPRQDKETEAKPDPAPATAADTSPAPEKVSPPETSDKSPAAEKPSTGDKASKSARKKPKS